MDLSALLDAGEVSPVDILEGFLDRCDQINPQLNALVLIDRDGARIAAKASEGRIRDGARRGVLDGLPITIKDNIFVAGLRATWGSRLFADFVPADDDLPVARLRKAGAVIVGKTNTPEFAMLPVTENKIFGVTRNPWNTDLTPGGSSGGAVASVAAGMVPLALATDAGGSIRRPAGYAGVVGLRPSNGRVARDLGFPAVATDFQTIGPIARSVADVAAVFSCIAGPNAADRPPAGRATRICYVASAGSGPIDPEIAESVKAAAEAFAELGHRVDEASAPYDPEEIDRIWSVLIGVGMRRVVDAFDGWREQIDDSLAQAIERAASVSASDYDAALERVSELRRQFARWLGDFDAVLTPSSAALPWPVARRYPATIDGREASPRAAAVFATFVNAVGHPAISLPATPSKSGLPIGLQLVGRLGEDERILDLAGEFEAARPWCDRWPALADLESLTPCVL